MTVTLSLLDRIRSLYKDKEKSASVAKERLQIIVSHQRANRMRPDFLHQLEKDILAVVAQYVEIDLEQVKVGLERTDDCAYLELNIALPKEKEKERA